MWVWAAIILQFLVLYSLAPAFAVFIRANPLALALRMLMPAGLVVASLVGLWHGRKWGWVLATLVDGVMCLQALWALPEFGVTAVWKFAAVVVLLQKPVRSHFFDPEGYLGRAIPSPRVPAGLSHFAQLVGSRSTRWYSSVSPGTKVVAIFCLAGFLSAGTFISYSDWIHSQYEANEARYQRDSVYGYADTVRNAQSVWAAEKGRIAQYAGRGWLIFFLGFPVGITLALLISIGTRWLPRTLVPGMLPGLILPYVGSAMALVSLMLFAQIFGPYLWVLGIVPALIVYASFLSFSAMLLTSRWPWKFFHAIWISGVIWPAILWITPAKLEPHLTWVQWLTWLQGHFLVLMEMTWAGMYGKVLTDSAAFSETNPPSIVGTQRKLG